MNKPHKFEVLLDQWRANEAEKQGIQEKQDTLTDAISVAFADVVREGQLLAPLKWDFSATGRGASLSCRFKKDDAAWELLDKFEWENSRYHYHAILMIGKHAMYTDDGVLRFYFDSIDECVAFCKEQGIKAERAEIKAQRDRALSEAERLGKLIETLG